LSRKFIADSIALEDMVTTRVIQDSAGREATDHQMAITTDHQMTDTLTANLSTRRPIQHSGEEWQATEQATQRATNINQKEIIITLHIQDSEDKGTQVVFDQMVEVEAQAVQTGMTRYVDQEDLEQEGTCQEDYQA
jgi:hypothetical protein